MDNLGKYPSGLAGHLSILQSDKTDSVKQTLLSFLKILNRQELAISMQLLVILNDPPYGTERSYNGLRLAMALRKENPDSKVMVFLIGDAISCAKSGQKTPDGYYNLERMIRGLVTKDVEIKCCGTCIDARGIDESSLVVGVKRGTMSVLAAWTNEYDKVITF